MLLDAEASPLINNLTIISELERKGASASPQSLIGLFLVRYATINDKWPDSQAAIMITDPWTKRNKSQLQTFGVIMFNALCGT